MFATTFATLPSNTPLLQHVSFAFCMRSQASGAFIPATSLDCSPHLPKNIPFCIWPAQNPRNGHPPLPCLLLSLSSPHDPSKTEPSFRRHRIRAGTGRREFPVSSRPCFWQMQGLARLFLSCRELHSPRGAGVHDTLVSTIPWNLSTPLGW